MNNYLFKNSLTNNNKNFFDKIDKGDLHTHSLLSSNRIIFSKFFPNIKLNKFENDESISSLSIFIKNNILNLSTNLEGYSKLIECSIMTAINDGISKFDTSIDYRIIYELFDNDIEKMVYNLKKLKLKYINKINLNFDLGISRNAFKKEHEKIIILLIKCKIFNGIDLYGDELSKPIEVFKKIYRIAKKEKMELKAHVGEFGTSSDIYNAIKILKLDVVQHGISITNDEKVMRYAKKKNIQFNVCPISNLKLNRVPSIIDHPIRKMYDFGLIITINTDDQLIFENSLFDEYIILFKNHIFSADELNVIRLNSLKKDKY